MGARDKTLAVLKRHTEALEKSRLQAQMKIAGLNGDVSVVGEANSKKASDIDNELGGQLKRNIPKDYNYNPQALKPLARMLWAMSVALGHALAAHRQLTKVKSSTISPDGLIGGRGYVMSVKDVRKALYDACESLSAISDTVHDELNAPHWKPKLAELEKADIEKVERLVGEAEQLMDNPEREVNDEMEEAEEEGSRADLDGDGNDGEDEAGSEMPDGKDLADTHAKPQPVKQASVRTASVVEAFLKKANSSLPVETVPGGPRVDSLDRGEQTGPGGSYNVDEPASDDPWAQEDGVGHSYDYRSEWDNELNRTANSNLPGAMTDRTPTEGDDFGLGYGNGDDAHGQGTDGPAYSPAAQLPNDPGGKMYDDVSDTTPMVELSVGKSAASEVPNILEFDRDTKLDVHPGKGERHEQSQPYIKWDPNTHNMRPDYIYQREVQGPYVKQGQEG